ARDISFSLPSELSDEENIALAREFIATNFVALGMVADMCIHRGSGDEQPHVHLMLTTRTVDEDGFGQKNTEWNRRSLYIGWREEWANEANRNLAKADFDIRIDHRSNKDRGIDLEPQNKKGSVNAQERFTKKVLEHEDIARRNGDAIYANPGIALDALTKYTSTFTLVDLAKFINTHTVDLEQFGMVYEQVKSSKLMVKLGEDEKGRERYTSKEMLEIEYRMVRQAEGLERKSFHTVDLEMRESISKKYGFSENQEEAFYHTTGDRDISCIVGYAGTGKSYMLCAAREVWEREGYNVVGMTLSGIAAEGLESASGIKSYTVANRLTNWDNDRERVKKNDIIVVDEAGMLGSRALGRIIDEAVLHNAKVVLVGDPRQLQAIEAGGAFRGILERVGHVHLSEIRRQKENWQKEA
ncbi:Ti-type conjugative transfer relaxase TraA, partial [Rickettsiales endosymbiont of Peranema trichophorum]|uniref:AAA family ATPase n=1 Tax=Rickettsiales endosymbiont of Peranema trichophorum TaxID=2486577 RepID=UPI0010F052C9